MSAHKLFVANGVFPRFTSTPTRYRSGSFRSRARYIAELVAASGADCATFGELGRAECATLAEFLPMQYDRTQGNGRQEGLNSCWSSPDVFTQDEDDLDDWNMPSAGQWVRTLLYARLVEKADPTAFVGLVAGHETLTNAGGLAYVKALTSRLGDRRTIIGMDFKRTQDADDLAWMKRSGYTVHERTRGTPMACFTKGNVKVTGVDHVSRPKAFDHEYLVVDFSIPTGKTGTDA